MRKGIGLKLIDLSAMHEFHGQHACARHLAVDLGEMYPWKLAKVLMKDFVVTGLDSEIRLRQNTVDKLLKMLNGLRMPHPFTQK